MYIRPYPLSDNNDTFQHVIGRELNNSRIFAGRGIEIGKYNNGFMISVKRDYLNNKTVYRGEWDPTAEYFPNDIVVVNGCNNYTDPTNTGSVIPYDAGYPTSYTGSYTKPYLAAGAYVCVKYVPPSSLTSTLLLSTVAPNMSTWGGFIDTEFADGYRHYSNNVYYPIFPSIPTASQVQVAESAGSLSWTTTANDTFWDPLSPCVVMTQCVNGTETKILVSGYPNALSFDNGRLPYTGS
jgi:hypothetical protein